MKNIFNYILNGATTFLLFIVISYLNVSCKKFENPIKYKMGYFNDTVTVALEGIIRNMTIIYMNCTYWRV